MKILHLLSARQYVGEAARVMDLAEAQAELGHDVKVVARRDTCVAEEARSRAFETIEAGWESKFSPISDWRDFSMLRTEATRADIVHAHRSKEHWLAAFAVQGNTPLIRTRHVVTNIKSHLANRWLYANKTAGIICVSRAVEEVVKSSLPGCSEKIQVIPGGIRPLITASPEDAGALANELNIPKGSAVVCLLGRPDEVKGHVHVVDAMADIVGKHPNIIFVFAYPRDNLYRKIIQSRTEEKGLGAYVRWVGRLESISPLLGLTSIGLVASIGSEGWSRAAIEYLSFGIPVVATTVGSLPEIVEDGRTGFLIAPGDSPAIGDAIMRIMDDEALCRSMSKNARTASEKFTRSRMAQDVIDFYGRISASLKAGS